MWSVWRRWCGALHVCGAHVLRRAPGALLRGLRREVPLPGQYAGGFHPYGSLEEHWAYWSRYVWVNRYVRAPGTAYEDLLELVRGRDYFVLTTNVDHQFQLAGFDRRRLFYTQGDYGLLQCSEPCHARTYDNEPLIRAMVEMQGWRIGADGSLTLPPGADLALCALLSAARL